MKNLFFVAVAFGIFSGTSMVSKAQTSVNSVKFSSKGLGLKKSIQFIEDIEIKQDLINTIESGNKPVVKYKPSEGVSNLQESSTSSTQNQITESTIEASSALQFKFAQLMNVDVETITNLKLYQTINEWWATRYVYGGTTKRGIDCSAYTGTVYLQSFGITLPRTAHEQYAICEKISRNDLQEGDLVFFNTTGGVSHVGLYLGNGYFTHASVHSGITISSLNENYYSQKFIGGGRVNK